MEKIHEVYIGHSMLIIKNGRIDIEIWKNLALPLKILTYLI